MLSRARVIEAPSGAAFSWPRTSDGSDGGLSRPIDEAALPVAGQPSRPAPDAVERDAFAAGYAQGERAGFEAGAQRADAMLRRLAATIDEITQLRRSVITQAETEMVQVAIAIARRILHREITINHDVVITLARVALERLGGAASATIRLNPEDCALVQADRREDWAGVRVTVVPDQSIPRGGCRVQSDIGLIEASVDAQLDRVASELLGDHPITTSRHAALDADWPS